MRVLIDNRKLNNMTFVSQDQIRDMAIKTVEGFLNGKVPLSEGLSKYASENTLNPEQIKRAVEATNSIAYLKVLSMSDDRTMEFPLCKYAEVMQHVSVPDIMLKQATLLQPPSPGKTIAYPAVEQLVKEAGAVAEKSPLSSLTDAETQVYFIKLAADNKRQLDALKERSLLFGPELIKAAKDLKNDPECLEKLATVAEGKEFSKVTTLVFGSPQEYADTGMFKTAELKEAQNLVEMIKTAEYLVAETKAKQELYDKSELVKQAFLGAIGAGIGRLAGAAAAAPFRVAGVVAGRAGKRISGLMGRSSEGAANTVRTTFGSAPKPVTPMSGKKKFGITAGLGATASVATDASMYSPGKDKITGRSKDVWTSLQHEPNN